MDSDKKMRPIFGYIGGKTWLKKELREAVLKKISKDKEEGIVRYVEPFCGGLGSFISIYDILIENGIKDILLNDVNQSLIVFYQILNEYTEELIEEYIKIDDKFDSLIPKEALLLDYKKDKCEIKKILQEASDYYKIIRYEFNNKKQSSITEDKIKNSARLLFLQNHCFNNIYRENKKGEYNTPFNWDTKKRCKNLIKDRVFHLKNIFKKFDNIILQHEDYKYIEFKKNDLIYCDPPYIRPDEEKGNNYYKVGFNDQTQLELIEKISKYKFIYSNHKNKLLMEEFRKIDGINVKEINRKNFISVKTSSRNNDKVEILVMN